MEKLNDKYKEGFDSAGKLIYGVFTFTLELFQALLQVIVILGAITSFILLALLYPQIFRVLADVVLPVLRFIFIFIIILLKIVVGMGVGWVIFKLAVFLIDKSNENKIKRIEIREKFLDELVIKLNQKIKKKR